MPILVFIQAYKTWLEIAAILALIGGLFYLRHLDTTHQQGIGEARVRAQWVAADKLAADAQRLREQLYQKDVDNAQAQAVQSRQLAASAAIAAAGNSRLLNTAVDAIRTGAGSAPIDALRRDVAALTAVLPECEQRYRSVAQDADGHAADSLMLQRAWPKSRSASGPVTTGP